MRSISTRSSALQSDFLRGNIGGMRYNPVRGISVLAVLQNYHSHAKSQYHTELDLRSNLLKSQSANDG
jgi:hypothetical protein